MQPESGQAMKRHFIAQWSAYLTDHAERFCHLFSDIRYAAKYKKDALVHLNRSSNPAESWRREVQYLREDPKNADMPDFPAFTLQQGEKAAWLLRAMEMAGIYCNHGDEDEMVLTPFTADAYQNDGEPYETVNDPLLPGEVARIVSPAWYQRGRCLCQGRAVRVFSPFTTERAFIRFEAYNEFSRDFDRGLGPNSAWIDFSFIGTPERKRRIDLLKCDPGYSYAVIEFDLPPGTLVKAEIWVNLVAGSRLLSLNGETERPGEVDSLELLNGRFGHAFMGLLTRVNREDNAFVLFVEGLGFVHFSCWDSKLLPPESQVGTLLRVLPADHEELMAIDPLRSEYAAYPPATGSDAASQAALDALRLIRKQLTDAFAR